MRKPVFRASRLGALLLAAVMALALLPAGAMAEEIADVTVSEEESLRLAVESGTYDTVRLSQNIKLSAPLTVSGKLTLDLGGNRLSAALDPESVSAPLATIILKKGAKLTVAGKDGSEVVPPVLPEGKTDKCYGIYVNENGSLKLSEKVKVKTGDDTSYMVFLLSETVFSMEDEAQIRGGLFGIKIPSGTEIKKMTITADGSIASESAISKTDIPFSDIVAADCLITADGQRVEDLSSAPNPGVKKYVFAPGAAPAPTATPTPAPTATPTTAPSTEPTTSPTATPTTAPSTEPTTAPTATPTTAPSTEPTTSPTATPTTAPS
ncbi:MAG: hypothetical protein II776_07870, partial [Clostridia bacterium]|nr:hypothetical protein [Clostridia bacterium]